MIRRKKTLPAATRQKASNPKKPVTGNQPGRMTMLPPDEVEENTRRDAAKDSENTTKDIITRATKPSPG